MRSWCSSWGNRVRPTRRDFLQSLTAGSAVLLAQRPFPLATWLPGSPAPFTPSLPSPAQLAWLDLEIGMFVHFAPNTWQDKEGDDGSIRPAQLPFAADPVQWADTALALGARYVVLVAKHVGGFCLWQTTSSDYSVRNTPWKNGQGDVMAELAAACRARGLRLGVYLSPRDDFFGAGLAGRCDTPERQAAYNRAARQQLTELLTRYGPLAEVWFDGSSVVPVGDILAEHAGGAMVFQGPHATIRWVGNEDGFAPDPVWNALAKSDADTGIATALHGDPRGDAWMPLEVDVSIRRPNWFWSTTNQRNLLTLPQLLDVYYRSVGRGAQLLLNLPPDRTGRIPAADAARVGELGAEVRRRFETPVAEAAGEGPAVTLSLPGDGLIDHVILEEDLRGGQRILSYRLEGLTTGRWRVIGEGTSVGHKRIHPVTPDRYLELRATFPTALDRPRLRRLTAFRTGALPPAGWRQGADIWADDEVGRWTAGAFDVDLTPRIPAAAQYRLRFVARGAAAPRIRTAELLVNEVAQPALLTADPARGDLLLLTVPGLGQRIRLRGRLEESSAGIILMRRL